MPSRPRVRRPASVITHAWRLRPFRDYDDLCARWGEPPPGLDRDVLTYLCRGLARERDRQHPVVRGRRGPVNSGWMVARNFLSDMARVLPLEELIDDDSGGDGESDDGDDEDENGGEDKDEDENSKTESSGEDDEDNAEEGKAHAATSSSPQVSEMSCLSDVSFGTPSTPPPKHEQKRENALPIVADSPPDSDKEACSATEHLKKLCRKGEPCEWLSQLMFEFKDLRIMIKQKQVVIGALEAKGWNHHEIIKCLKRLIALQGKMLEDAQRNINLEGSASSPSLPMWASRCPCVDCPTLRSGSPVLSSRGSPSQMPWAQGNISDGQKSNLDKELSESERRTTKAHVLAIACSLWIRVVTNQIHQELGLLAQLLDVVSKNILEPASCDDDGREDVRKLMYAYENNDEGDVDESLIRYQGFAASAKRRASHARGWLIDDKTTEKAQRGGGRQRQGAFDCCLFYWRHPGRDRGHSGRAKLADSP